jgi:hypothetical protein
MKIRCVAETGISSPDGQVGDINGENTSRFLGVKCGIQATWTAKLRAADGKPPLDQDKKGVYFSGGQVHANSR